jgi:hypothetical protein
VAETFEWVWQLFAYLLPSIIMLSIMWRRRYLDISDRNLGGVVDDWRRGGEHRSSSPPFFCSFALLPPSTVICHLLFFLSSFFHFIVALALTLVCVRVYVRGTDGVELATASSSKAGSPSAASLLSRQPLQLAGTGFDAGKCFDELDAGLKCPAVPRLATHLFQAKPMAQATAPAAGGRIAATARGRAKSATVDDAGRDRSGSAAAKEKAEKWLSNTGGNLSASMAALGSDEHDPGDDDDDASAAARAKGSRPSPVFAPAQSSSSSSSSVATEALVPPAAGLAVAQAFVLKCALPQLER